MYIVGYVMVMFIITSIYQSIKMFRESPINIYPHDMIAFFAGIGWIANAVIGIVAFYDVFPFHIVAG